VGDFSWYDQVLDLSALLGVVPDRFQHNEAQVSLDTYFRMARGRAPSGKPTAACEMTKWFDTNYHYLVPEFAAQQGFSLSSDKLFNEVDEAIQLGHKTKPVLVISGWVKQKGATLINLTSSKSYYLPMEKS